MPEDVLKLDWVNLPPRGTEVSLWPCLHDGHLQFVRSDTFKRTLALEIDVSHLRSYHQWDDEIRIRFQLEDVQSVRAIISTMWATPALDINGPITIPGRLNAEYQENWREESLSWNAFESAFASDSLDISDAFTVWDSSTFTLQLRGFLDGDVFDDQYVTVFVRAATCTISLSDNSILTIEQLMELGTEYWDNFENRLPATE